jgi:hypothetical protein
MLNNDGNILASAGELLPQDLMLAIEQPEAQEGQVLLSLPKI